MAQYNSDSFEGTSNLPTNSHGGMQMAHRSVISFPKDTALVVGDKLVLGILAPGYVIDRVVADTEGFANLKVSLTKHAALNQESVGTIATEISLITAGQAQATLTAAEIKARGANVPLFLVATVTAAGTVGANKEIGIRFEYRYRQVAY